MFRDAGGELARCPSTPGDLGTEPASSLHHFDETEPSVANTVRVDIEGPRGAVIATRSAGSAVPADRVVSPNGGETLSGDTATVTWTASDADGDPLTATVRYGDDDGAT